MTHTPAPTAAEDGNLKRPILFGAPDNIAPPPALAMGEEHEALVAALMRAAYREGYSDGAGMLPSREEIDARLSAREALLAALLAARDDARVILTCRRCGFNAGNCAIFENHWQANHTALAATPGDAAATQEGT